MMILPYQEIQKDTFSVCMRNSIADVTFYDSANLVTVIKPTLQNSFPFTFIEKNIARESESKAILIKQLKQGIPLPEKPFAANWIVLIILFGAFLYALVRAASKTHFTEIGRFFLFRGIGDSISRDLGGLFHWQSSVLNLASFLGISLFGYCAAEINNLIPLGISSLATWTILLGIIITAVTLRHFTSIITGNISEKNELFREYLYSIYQSYRSGALVLYIIIVLMLYTNLLTDNVFVFTGLIVLCIMYLIRIIRLLIIFMNRNISIFYLILYLCALEILPVVISVKYFTGLV